MKKYETKRRFTMETTTTVAELATAQLARVHGGHMTWEGAPVPRPAGATDGNDPWPRPAGAADGGDPWP
jgi:hypothetical protein